MNICTDSQAIAPIDLDECLGLSLATINTNFNLLKEANCFTDEELTEKQNQINDLTTKVNSLSTDLIKIAQGLVVFDGTNNPATIIKSSRVARVNRLSTGVFELSFVPSFSDTNYLIVGTCIETSTNSKYTWMAPTSAQTISTSLVNVRNESGNFINPNYASISIFTK